MEVVGVQRQVERGRSLRNESSYKNLDDDDGVIFSSLRREEARVALYLSFNICDRKFPRAFLHRLVTRLAYTHLARDLETQLKQQSILIRQREATYLTESKALQIDLVC